MSRDLPFDEDDSGAGDHAGDTAYHIATGVARVARAGAYVTGGALIAANGSPAPANESHSSRITGWASADPQPDAPSPVVSYPDPEPGSAPPPVLGKHVPAPVSAPLTPAHPEPAAGPFGLPELNGTMAEGAPNLEIPATGNGGHGDHSPAMGLPSLDNSTGSDAPFGIPGAEHGTSGFELPSLPTHPAHGPGGFDLPGLDAHPAALPLNHGLGLPGTNGLNLPGMNGLGPGGVGLPESGVQDHSPFDGAGGGHPGMFLGTEMKIDAHIGLDGVWFTSEAKIDFAVGDVGHQLDDYSNWLGSGIHHIPTGDGSQGVPDLVAGLGHPATPNAVGGPMAAGSHGPHGHAVGAHPHGAVGAHPHGAVGAHPHGASAHGSAPLGSSPGAASGSTAPGAPVGAPAPQPVSVAPAPSFTAAPTPAVAVVPASPAPVAVSAPVANVAVAQPFTPPAPALAPVAATPLQTSNAPEVASHPIAAVLPTHAGPAAAVPVIAGGHGSGTTKATTSPSSTTGKTTAEHPSTSTAPMSQPQTDVEKPSSVPHVSIPPTSVTRPGDATTTTGDSTTGHTGGVTTTRPGDSTSTRPGDTSTRPSDSTDPTTPATGTGGSTGTTGSTPTGTHDPDAGATPPATGNTGHGPTGTEPTAPHPTVPTGHDTPTAPGHEPSVPTTPVTVSPNSGDIGGVGGGAGVHPVPVEPPHTVTPPVGGGGVAPTQVPVKPVAHVVDAYDHSPWVDDHSTLTVAAGGALSSQLLPDATYAELHHPVLHPVADMHITL